MGANFAQVVTQIVVLMALARLVEPEDFGLLSAAMVVVAFSMIFTSLGVGPAIVQREHLEIEHIKTGQTTSLLFGLASFATVYSVSPLISGFFRNPGLVDVVRALSVIFLIQGFSMVSEALYQRELNFKKLARVQVVSYVFGYGAVTITVALLGFQVWALVCGHLSQEIIKSAMLMAGQRRKLSYGFNKDAFRELMYFGGGFTLARVFNFAALQGDNIVVGRALGAEALGLYGRVYQLMALPAVTLGQVLDKVLFPVMSRIQGEPQRLKEMFCRGIALVALFVIPFSVYCYVHAQEIIHLVLGPAWNELQIPFQIFSLAMFFRAGYKISESLARATGSVYRRAWRQAIYAGSVIGGAWIGHYWGLEGVVSAVLVALILNYLLMAQLSLGIVQMRWRTFFGLHIGPLLIASLTGIILMSSSQFFKALAFDDAAVIILDFAIFAILFMVSAYAYLRNAMNKRKITVKDVLHYLQDNEKERLR